MGPPGKRIRPAGEPSGSHETTSGQQVDTDTVPDRTDKQRHGSQFCRWKYFDRHRRRLEHIERKALHPWTPPPPSDFGLSRDELRAHARDLYRDGWPVDEITAVLAIEPAGAR
jgi:hypothetical protein